MLTIRCIFVTIVVAILLDEGNCNYQGVNWREYKKAYGINQENSEYRFYMKLNNEASNGYTGSFRINGVKHTLPVAATNILLFTNNTIPFWYTSSSMMIFMSYLDGSPLKVSTLHENGSITVNYLGNKFDPMCKNFNCQAEEITPLNSFKKNEVVDPNGWTSFHAVLAPNARGVGGTIEKTPDVKLTCNLNRD